MRMILTVIGDDDVTTIAGVNAKAVDAVRRASILREGRRIYVLSGCEFEGFRAIRAYLRHELRLLEEKHLVVSYWRRGAGEEE